MNADDDDPQRRQAEERLRSEDRPTRPDPEDAGPAPETPQAEVGGDRSEPRERSRQEDIDPERRRVPHAAVADLVGKRVPDYEPHEKADHHAGEDVQRLDPAAESEPSPAAPHADHDQEGDERRDTDDLRQPGQD